MCKCTKTANYQIYYFAVLHPDMDEIYYFAVLHPEMAPQMSRGQMFVGPCQDLPGNVIDYKYLIPNLYHATDVFGGKQS